ncbi:NapC/NirT family cytochrome c [Dethiobacter alkaliphilus]|uniref:NapC/NirT cytochrome c N-terminal domain-containing protein n=1 Tax=Dethiobacter alkaliphilus AHT 1 TaxID=555088 RepID=C0GG40_DETAL|nr:NapC/NirT family cytochrome c [Dethiobacter alkaliphilus]EEG77729.1 hypothetical protein DealDRAFT_1449 [Dethiobacter alkaliphilus AHT 1]
MGKLSFRKGDSHDESHGNKKMFYVLGGLIIVLLVFLLGVAATDSTNPDSCASCHVMEPYYYTWQNSPHANVSCDNCHVEPGTGFVQVQAQRISEWITYRTSDVALPIEGNREISDETCLSCHSTNRQITPGLDLRGGDWHAEHLGYGTSCVDCHYEVGHAGLSIKETFEPTTEVIAQFQETEYRDFSLTKTSCLECHDGERVTYNCEICHTDIGIPDDHYRSDFGYNHGDEVREDIDDCMRCHTGFGKVREVPGHNIAAMTRNAKFCVDCHEGQRPVTHDAYFSVGHKIPALEDQSGCMVCHDWNEPEEGVRQADVITCGQCHDMVPDGHDDPRWYWDHLDVVREQGSFGCFDCHGATSCFDCHTEENVGW